MKTPTFWNLETHTPITRRCRAFQGGRNFCLKFQDNPPDCQKCICQVAHDRKLGYTHLYRSHQSNAQKGNKLTFQICCLKNLTLSLKEFRAVAIIRSPNYNQLGDKVKINSISYKKDKVLLCSQMVHSREAAKLPIYLFLRPKTYLTKGKDSKLGQLIST